jgi:vacuolar-type H+-ATPase subunit C/Vma6
MLWPLQEKYVHGEYHEILFLNVFSNALIFTYMSSKEEIQNITRVAEGKYRRHKSCNMNALIADNMHIDP